MKEIGVFLIICGIGLGLYAFSMDTSVKTSYLDSERVVNLGLMNKQQNLIICACAVSIMGVMLVISTTLHTALEGRNHAVKTLVRDASTKDESDDVKLSPEKKELKAKFERSEISLEEYREAWNKLA